MSTKPAAAKQVLAAAKPKSDIGPSFFVLDDGPLEIDKAPVAPLPGMMVTQRTWVTPVKESWERLRALPDDYPKTMRTLSALTGVCLVGTLLVMRSRMPEAWAPAMDDLPPASASAAASVLPAGGAANAQTLLRQSLSYSATSLAKFSDSKTADRDTMAALASLAASLQQDAKEEERLRVRNRRLEALVKVLRNRSPKPTVQQTE